MGDDNLELRSLLPEDAGSLEAAFAAIGWSKPASLFERYGAEQAAGERWVRVATWSREIAGYVTVLWRSRDPVFREADIPEIEDLNVLPAFRGRRIGWWLMDAAEAEIRDRASVAGLRVGLHSGYGAAQRLYIRRGYLPDGSGAVVDGKAVPEGALIPLDDEVTLRMRKRLR